MSPANSWTKITGTPLPVSSKYSRTPSSVVAWGIELAFAPVVRIVGARQHHDKLCEIAGLGRNIDRSAMLLDDDVVSHRKAETRPLAGRLGGEERVEHLLLHLGRDSGPVVADANFHGASEISGRGPQRRLECRLAVFRLVSG